MDTSLLHSLSRNWGWILLRGVLAILFGLAAFAWPLLTLKVLILLYGAYVLADGIMAIVAAMQGGELAPRWWLAVVGVLGVAAGVILFLRPGFGGFALLMIIGIMAIVRGIFEIVGAISVRKQITGEWLLILGGIASILFGLVVLIFPGAGALAMVWLIAAYSVTIGILFCALAFRLRSHARSRAVRA